MPDRFADWMAALEARHLSDLTFPEVSRALRALSSTYVERREKLKEGAALDGAGKRAAFALFYGPLHFLLVRHIAQSLQGAALNVEALVDLGCGTGASGAAWAGVCEKPPGIVGIDRHPWALTEAAHTYRAFGLPARTRRGDVASEKLPGGRSAILAAFTLNELPDEDRDSVLTQLVDRASRAGHGDRVLIVEPLAGFVARWWGQWAKTFEAAGGRSDEWRVRADLPLIVAKLDRAAGLDHREITGRSIYIGRG